MVRLTKIKNQIPSRNCIRNNIPNILNGTHSGYWKWNAFQKLNMEPKSRSVKCNDTKTSVVSRNTTELNTTTHNNNTSLDNKHVFISLSYNCTVITGHSLQQRTRILTLKKVLTVEWETVFLPGNLKNTPYTSQRIKVQVSSSIKGHVGKEKERTKIKNQQPKTTVSCFRKEAARTTFFG